MKEKEWFYISFGPLHRLVKELCAVLYRLLPVVGMRIHTHERNAKGELTLVFFLRRPDALPSVEFLHALVETLRRTPFTVKYRVVNYKQDDYRRKYAATFYITVVYQLELEAGRG